LDQQNQKWFFENTNDINKQARLIKERKGTTQNSKNGKTEEATEIETTNTNNFSINPFEKLGMINLF
jgi:hypothetical protein